MDLVTIRENTEGEYSGIEHEVCCWSLIEIDGQTKVKGHAGKFTRLTPHSGTLVSYLVMLQIFINSHSSLFCGTDLCRE